MNYVRIRWGNLKELRSFKATFFVEIKLRKYANISVELNYEFST